MSQMTVMITIGNGYEFALTEYNNLAVRDVLTGEFMDLGPLTQQRAKELGEYLQRLAIHTPEK